MGREAEQDLAHLRFKHSVNLERFVPLALVGDHLMPSPLSRIALIFCRAGSLEDLRDLYQATLAGDLYEVLGRGGRQVA